jgi:hypothetical protein
MTLCMPDDLLSDEQFNQLLPLAVAWAETQEKRILRDGTPLSPTQLEDALAVGVAAPGRVRILAVPAIPFPEDQFLQAAGEVMQLISPFTLGLTLRHGIFIRADFLHDRWLIAHELTHTAQYERLGGTAPFLRQYLYECMTVGYGSSPLEQEAIVSAERLRRRAEG